MAPHIFPRQGDTAITNNVAIGLIAGFICIIVLLCLLCLFRFHRLKAGKRRNEEWDAAFLRVESAVRPAMTETNLSSTSIPPFSRHGLTASVAMPEKSITRKPSSHRFADKATISSPLPASSLLSRDRSPSNSINSPHRPRSTLNPAYIPPSRSSIGSAASIFLSSPTQARPVRQLFDPVLPDELSPLRYGECLTVLRSFDDDWCLAARDVSRLSHVSHASMTKSGGDTVDIGLVPKWVFIKPLKGVAFTRPHRVSSVNALSLGQGPAPASARDAIISWSNLG